MFIITEPVLSSHFLYTSVNSWSGFFLEGVTDFKALRAKFQNDSNLANKLLQKPPTEISPKPGSAGSTPSSPLPLTKREVKVSKPAHPTSQSPVLTQHKPLARPQGWTGHNKEHKDSASEKGLSSPKSSPEKPLLSHGTDQQGSSQTTPEDPSLQDSFQHILQIWEETLSHKEKTSPRVPTPRAANPAPAASGSDRMPPSGSSPVLNWHSQRKDALHGSGIAPPQAPRGHRSCDGAGAEGVVASEPCQSGHRAPREPPQHQEELEPPFWQPGAGKWSYSPGSKWPRIKQIKPLPSAESLGPAPGKPPRPPKVDLSAFQSTMPLVHRGNETTAGEEDYLTPESAQLEEENNYEETPMYLNQSGDTTTLCVIEVPKAEPQKHKKQKIFPFAKSSPERALTEDEKEGKPSHERTKLEENEIFKTGGNEYMCPTSHARADGRGGLEVLQGQQDVTSPQTATYPTPPGLAKDRAEHWHSVGVGAPQAEGTALGQTPWQPLQASEDIYDDIEELQDRLSHGSDASSSFTSDSISGNSNEETYEDVEIGGDNPAKPETEKQKRFGNLFKIEKLKLNNFRLKDNLRLISISVPNLAVSQEDNVYDDVEVGQRETRGKDEKYRVRMPRLRMMREYKDKRKSIDDVDRNIFKFKKSSEEKSKKMDKEEKLFRETFMYDKEIRVLATASAQHSVPSQRRADLPLTAGEQLDVIDVLHGHAVICRNAQGRYGYVLVEHLNFRQTILTALRAALPWSIPEGLFGASCIRDSPCWSAVG
ncbi:FYN-binding protein 2 isoform X3 [Chamaea fasciata]|uniref:FYN-binding protein 2 isoform X3 n=1 Tax=Chamaea fasciata TaxID=190680 RepID=UPI003369EBF6